MSELNFKETAAKEIYTDILEELENGVGEPLFKQIISSNAFTSVIRAMIAGCASAGSISERL